MSHLVMSEQLFENAPEEYSILCFSAQEVWYTELQRLHLVVVAFSSITLSHEKQIISDESPARDAVSLSSLPIIDEKSCVKSEYCVLCCAEKRERERCERGNPVYRLIDNR